MLSEAVNIAWQFDCETCLASAFCSLFGVVEPDCIDGMAC